MMWGRAQTLLSRFHAWRYGRAVRRALALQLRGEARSDGLDLVRVRNRLEIRWRSRDTHPWDCDVTGERREQLFREQLVADTEAAILRLFDAFPQIDRIDLQVLEPASEEVILSGTVYRSDLSAVQEFVSVRMRLQHLGVRFSRQLTP